MQMGEVVHEPVSFCGALDGMHVFPGDLFGTVMFGAHRLRGAGQ